MNLFDHDVRRIRAPRVNSLLKEADFLFARAADEVAEKLLDVKRDFPRAALVGTGGGAFAARLAGQVGKDAFVVVEDSPEAAAHAALAAPNAEVRFSPGDAADLSPGGFDLVLDAMTLHRADDPVGALARMRLALKPDGLCIAAMFGGRSLHELRAAFAEAEAEVEGGVSPRVSPMGEVRDLGGLLQRAGFALPVADVDTVEVAYETPFHLMRDLRAMGEANALLARRKTFTRRATMLRMAEIYAANFSRPDGRVTATFEIVFLTGWAPDASQPTPLRPGSAKARLADALGVVEAPAGEKAGE